VSFALVRLRPVSIELTADDLRDIENAATLGFDIDRVIGA
jgi:hypothetical protein